MKGKFYNLATATMLLAGTAAALAQGQERPAWMPTFAADGTVHVPAFELPPSDLASKEAVKEQKKAEEMQKARATLLRGNPLAASDIVSIRRDVETFSAPLVEAMMQLYPADIVEQNMGGVRVRVITPKGIKIDPRRVLIDLHGGGFMNCNYGCAVLESLPIAAMGGLKVIAVDYRQAPEHVFPAASEDATAVYRELLKSYRPRQIGIFGCSAGGTLTGQVAAWLPAHGLPQAGAIGIFGAGALQLGAGDSAWIAASIDGSHPPPQKPGITSTPPQGQVRSYFEGVKMDDPMVSPALDPAVAAKFPPTLIITGTRATDMSRAIVTHSKLLDAGVDSRLIVGEAMRHCYIYEPRLPESQSAYRQIVKFFRENLG